VVEPNQAAAAQAVASPIPEISPPCAHDGYEEFFRRSFREVVRAAMYIGATLQEAEEAANEALMGMLCHWDKCKGSLAYARKATVHNFIKAKTRGTGRVVQRLIERGYVPHLEDAEDSELTRMEADEWVAHVLSSLPPAQREVMELIMKGLDQDEIANALGKTKAAVRRNLCDARARLSRELNANGERRQDPDAQHRKQPPRKTAPTPGEEAR
jgi:RNA polymerase sigma factor (sigma-70 family)